MKIRNNLRFSSWVLLAGLCASLVLAGGLPEGWGWENGPLESFQAVTVLVGLGMAWLAAVVWLAMLGHERAWGAVFWPPQGMGVASEPLYRASALWGQPIMVLCWGQWLLVQHTQTWRASGYLQTMHFSLNSLGEGFD